MSEWSEMVETIRNPSSWPGAVMHLKSRPTVSAILNGKQAFAWIHVSDPLKVNVREGSIVPSEWTYDSAEDVAAIWEFD